MSVKPRVNLTLDSIILAIFLLTLVSGVALDRSLDSISLQSGAAVGSILQAGDIHPLLHLHVFMALGLIVMVAVHQFVHWKWITSQVKQLFRGRDSSRIHELQNPHCR